MDQSDQGRTAQDEPAPADTITQEERPALPPRGPCPPCRDPEQRDAKLAREHELRAAYEAALEQLRQEEALGSNDPDLTPDDQRLVQEVGDRWQKYEQRGLKLRHDTGRHINGHIGDPDKRQPHAARVIKALSLRLHMSESEISRMRRFAFSFPDFQQFQDQYPKLATWTQVKSVLDQLRKGEDPADGPARSDATLKVKRAIKLLQDNLAEACDALHAEDRKALEQLRLDIEEVVTLLASIDEKKQAFKASRSRLVPA